MAVNENFGVRDECFTYDMVIKLHGKKGMITVGDLKLDDDGVCRATTTEDNVLITRYLQGKLSDGDIHLPRARRLAGTLSQWRRFLHVPYDSATAEDIRAAVKEMKAGVGAHKRKYAQNTQNQMIANLKAFIDWLILEDVITPEKRALREIWHKLTPPITYTSVSPKDILTDEQVNKLIACTPHMRDKAWFSILFETNARPGEIANLTWGDLEITKERVHVSIIDNKWKKSTVVKNAFVFTRSSYIRELRKMQEGDTDHDFVFRLFSSNVGGVPTKVPVSREAMRSVLFRAAKLAGIKFPPGAKLRLFRVSGVTDKLKKGVLPLAVMKSTWASGMNSRMFKHYERLADVDLERMLGAASGVVEMPRPVMDEDNTAIICLCGARNAPGAKFCPDCGEPLTRKSAASRNSHMAAIDDLMDNDPEFRKVYAAYKRIKQGEEEA